MGVDLGGSRCLGDGGNFPANGQQGVEREIGVKPYARFSATRLDNRFPLARAGIRGSENLPDRLLDGFPQFARQRRLRRIVSVWPCRYVLMG